MTYRKLHRWDLSPEEAMQVQSTMRDQFVLDCWTVLSLEIS
jgi:hypothetical protein